MKICTFIKYKLYCFFYAYLSHLTKVRKIITLTFFKTNIHRVKEVKFNYFKN